MQPQKGVDWSEEDERAMIGHFQIEEIGGKSGQGCLVCCQTPDNFIKGQMT